MASRDPSGSKRAELVLNRPGLAWRNAQRRTTAGCHSTVVPHPERLTAEIRLARLRDELNRKRTGFHAARNRYLELAR